MIFLAGLGLTASVISLLYLSQHLIASKSNEIDQQRSVLSVAYALWGGFGIAATIAAGWVLFGQRLNNKGWAGVILLVAGMVLIKLA